MSFFKDVEHLVSLEQAGLNAYIVRLKVHDWLLCLGLKGCSFKTEPLSIRGAHVGSFKQDGKKVSIVLFKPHKFHLGFELTNVSFEIVHILYKGGEQFRSFGQGGMHASIALSNVQQLLLGLDLTKASFEIEQLSKGYAHLVSFWQGGMNASIVLLNVQDLLLFLDLTACLANVIT